MTGTQQAIQHLQEMVKIADWQIESVRKDRAPEFIANNLADAKRAWGELIQGLPIPGLYGYSKVIELMEQADDLSSTRCVGRYSISPQSNAVIEFLAKN